MSEEWNKITKLTNLNPNNLLSDVRYDRLAELAKQNPLLLSDLIHNSTKIGLVIGKMGLEEKEAALATIESTMQDTPLTQIAWKDGAHASHSQLEVVQQNLNFAIATHGMDVSQIVEWAQQQALRS
jgi:hypothetical protein